MLGLSGIEGWVLRHILWQLSFVRSCQYCFKFFSKYFLLYKWSSSPLFKSWYLKKIYKPRTFREGFNEWLPCKATQKFTYYRAHPTFSAPYIDEHEEYGDQQRHPSRNHVDWYQETDEWSNRQQCRGEVGVHEEWGWVSCQADLKTSQGPCVIGYHIKHLVTDQWFKKHVKLLSLEAISGCLGIVQVGYEERLRSSEFLQ